MKFLIALLFAFPSLHAVEVMTLAQTIVDQVLFVEEDFLANVPGVKGGSQLIDYDSLMQIASGTSNIVPGGSGVNVMKGLAHLGHSCAVKGKIGNDTYGSFYVEDLARQGVIPLLQPTNLPSGRCISLVTPDGERTMRAHLGASADVSDIDLTDQDLENVKIFHIEGYLLLNRPLIERLIRTVKTKEVKISLDLACFEIVKANRDFILETVKNGIDILFCNQEEAFALTNLQPELACEYLSQFCEVVVVTMGENGGWVQRGQEKLQYSAITTKVIDTTGAGDLFASGFLHGYLHNAPLEQCATYGSTLAASIVEEIGAQLPEPKWEKIRQQWKI